MCRKDGIDSEEIMEFRLAERFTFLEYVPVKGVPKNASAPDLLAKIEVAGSGQQTSGGDVPKRVPPGLVHASCIDGTPNTSSRCADQLSTCSSTGIYQTDGGLEAVLGTEGRSSRPKKMKRADTPSWSIGSALHEHGLCKPCAWFWRPGSCTNGAECQHCHLCPKGALQKRKFENRQLSTTKNVAGRCSRASTAKNFLAWDALLVHVSSALAARLQTH
ncbi:unnamed protein product [Durusdinium trenchii]|uniref:C3H1-type domain-containing protein n=1 Tax=Durusdinium trenchii TaxID=1381693 RepID=A0ABP0PBV8_9DINO